MSGRLDGVLAFLMRPRVRRVRRWSFLLTLPIALTIAKVHGAEQGALVIAVRATLWTVVALVAWRVGGERGDAVRDLLMHPRARAWVRAECDVLTALPRLAIVRRQASMAYHRGTFGFALALAFTPVVVAEGVALHLLLGGGWLAWILAGLHAYLLVWLWGFALGPRAYPHRIGARAAVLRSGPMYRAHVPLRVIASGSARRERVARGGLVERDGTVLLPSRDRVDVWLELSEPVRVQRPFGEPVSTRRLAVAADDPSGLLARLLVPERPQDARRTTGVRGALGALDLGALARDVAQPG